jgi:hypothetical protein
MVSLKSYKEFEEATLESATEHAQYLYNKFEDGDGSDMLIKYKSNDSKTVTQYELLKVWHMLKGSGIDLHYTVRKIDHTSCRVTLILMWLDECDGCSTSTEEDPLEDASPESSNPPLTQSDL